MLVSTDRITESITPKYKKGLVIFIDILGSQSQTDFDVLFEINNTFHTSLIDNEKIIRLMLFIKEQYTHSLIALILYMILRTVYLPKSRTLGNCLKLHFVTASQFYYIFYPKSLYLEAAWHTVIYIMKKIEAYFLALQ